MQSYWELPLYLLSGLLGSGHCLGMCGGFVIAIGLHDRSKPKAVVKQTAYATGRCFTYGSLGGLLAGIGKKLSLEIGYLGDVGALLAIVAGIVVVYLGAASLFGFSLVEWLSHARATRFPRKSCTSASLFAGVFKRSASGPTGAFLAGIGTGLLPCGLLYGMLSIAAASQSVTRGAMMMVIFGLGTSPALMALGVAGGTITVRWRGVLYKLAAASLIVAGILTGVRGVYALDSGVSRDNASKCPLCAKD
jgi:uncharacterized protein